MITFYVGNIKLKKLLIIFYCSLKTRKEKYSYLSIKKKKHYYINEIINESIDILNRRKQIPVFYSFMIF